MRVLVVDDDPDIRDVVSLVLGAEGHEVRSAGDGLEALDLIGAGFRPSVILLDMMMPRCDGEAFVKAVRAKHEVDGMRLVLLSGHASAREKAAELGARACLVKPVELEDLVRVIRDEEPPLT